MAADIVDLKRKLLVLVEEFNADELSVIVRQAERLRGGNRAYGPLNIGADGRRWTREGIEELLDGLVYFTCEAIKRENAEQRAQDADDYVEVLP